AAAQASLSQFLETGSPQSGEYRVVLPDYRVRWIHDRALLSMDGDEPLIHGVLVDVTEERVAREVDERVGRLFEKLIEHAREAVTIVDARGVVSYHNPSMGRVVGRPPEGSEEGTPRSLTTPADAARAHMRPP